MHLMRVHHAAYLYVSLCAQLAEGPSPCTPHMCAAAGLTAPIQAGRLNAPKPAGASEWAVVRAPHVCAPRGVLRVPGFCRAPCGVVVVHARAVVVRAPGGREAPVQANRVRGSLAGAAVTALLLLLLLGLLLRLLRRPEHGATDEAVGVAAAAAAVQRTVVVLRGTGVAWGPINGQAMGVLGGCLGGLHASKQTLLVTLKRLGQLVCLVDGWIARGANRCVWWMLVGYLGEEWGATTGRHPPAAHTARA